MGEMTNEAQTRLQFRPAAGVPSKLLNEGATVYEAEAAGVTYRIVGSIVDPLAGNGRRTFRAYRLVEPDGLKTRQHPAGEGGEYKTRKAAIAQAEADLVEVLADRRRQAAAASVRADAHALMVARAARVWRGEASSSRKLIGPAHAHLDAPCTDACYEQERAAPETVPGGETIEYALDKLRGAFELVCKSRNLWRDRALAAGDTPSADPALDDNVPELVERIVRRAQYVALRAVLAQVDAWLAKAGETCAPHVLRRGELAADSFRGMVNDAAGELGVPKPHRPTGA